MVEAYQPVSNEPQIENNGRIGVSLDYMSLNHNRAKNYHGTTYEDPVTLAKPISHNGSNPAHTRSKNVTGDSFYAGVEEWEYLDNEHVTEGVSPLTMNEGNGETDDDTPVEAGTLEMSGTNEWETVLFEQAFEETPIVTSQVQTHNGGDSVVTRKKGVSTAGFEVCMQEEEVRDQGGHTTETVGWFAIEPGTATIDGLDYEVGTKCCVQEERRYEGFDQNYSKPRFLADMQTTNSPNTAGLRYQRLDSDSVEFFVEEEQSDDSEMNHTYETVGYVVIDAA